uniref:Uncharacterized protein n=1 Tax=Rhinopithecus bieti TaxID=61621 RepID=A0A2K6K3Z2_RHIBE
MCTGALRARYTVCFIVWIHLTAQDRSVRTESRAAGRGTRQKETSRRGEAQGLREADSSLQKGLSSKAPVLWAGRGGCKLRRGR